MSRVLELSQLAERKACELRDLFEKHRTEQRDERGNPLFDMATAILAEVRDRNTELNDINEQLEKARAQEAYLDNEKRMSDLKEVVRTVPPASGGGNTAQPRLSQMIDSNKSLGDMITESKDYRHRSAEKSKFTCEIPGIDIKTLISLSAGYAPPNNRTDVLVPFANRRPVVADLIPSDPTERDIIKWMENTTFTNNAAAASEAAALAESAMVWTEQNSIVQKIGTWVPVTQEQVDDVPTFSGIINRNLLLMLQLVEETELLSGSGTPPHLTGFLNKSGVQTQAKSGDDPQDAVYKAFTLIRWTGFAEPSGVIMHPTDWQGIRLQRTTQGLYIFGEPSMDGPERLWGKPMVVTNAISQGTSLTGDFIMYSHISRKQGIVVSVSDSHDVYFIADKLAVKATMRESLEILRAAAFCKVTGL